MVDGLWLPAEEIAEQRVNARDEAFVGCLLHAEHEARHELLLPGCHLAGDLRVLADYLELDHVTGQLGGNPGDRRPDCSGLVF